MSKISVIVAVHNVEKYIERCARSLFGQTLDSMEYVFIDDCSPDNSIGIMQKVLEEFPHRKEQIKLIRHGVNQGIGAARNHGVAACTGDYVIHCDPDDWVDLDFYEKLYKKAIASGADVVCAPFCVEFEDKNKITRKPFFYIAADIQDYFNKNCGGHYNLWARLYKKEIALDSTIFCPTHITMCEDLLRNIQMLDRCNSIAFITDSYYHYFQNSTSIVHNFAEKEFFCIKEIIAILQKKYFDKYSSVCLNLKSALFLTILINLHKKPALYRLFAEEWTKTSIFEKIKMLTSTNCSLKEKLILLSTCFSKKLTIFLLRCILKK